MPAAYFVPPRGEPTPHPPGSEGKIAALAARAARGEPLFHPGDSRGDGHAPDRRTGPPAERGPPGVSRCRNRWRVRVSVRGLGQVHLGVYATREEAEAAARGFRLHDPGV